MHAAQQVELTRLFWAACVAVLVGTLGGVFLVILIHGPSRQPSEFQIAANPSGQDNLVSILEAARSDPLTTQPGLSPTADNKAQYKDPTLIVVVEATPSSPQLDLVPIFLKPVLPISSKVVEAAIFLTADSKPQCKDPTVNGVMQAATEAITRSAACGVSHPSVIHHPAGGCVNTTVEAAVQDRLGARMEVLFSVLLDKLDHQREELSRLKGSMLDLQETVCKDLGGCTNVEPMIQATLPQWGSHKNCHSDCFELYPRFQCSTGCLIYKIDAYLVALKLKDKIKPCIGLQKSSFYANPALHECFCKKQDVLVEGIAAKFGFVEKAVAVNGTGSEGCQSMKVEKTISIPDKQYAIVRLDALLLVVRVKGITPCKKKGRYVSMKSAVHDCAMQKLGMLMDAASV